MRSNPRAVGTFTLGALGVAAVTAISLGAGTSAATAFTPDQRAGQETSTTEHQRGHMIECTGLYRGKDVYTSAYENDVHGNFLQVVIGDNGNGAGRQVHQPLVDGTRLRGGLQLTHGRAVVRGEVKRVGKKYPIHEEYDDAGNHITVDGFHRRLATDVVLRYRGATVSLDCENPVAYSIDVTTEDTTGD